MLDVLLKVYCLEISNHAETLYHSFAYNLPFRDFMNYRTPDIDPERHER